MVSKSVNRLVWIDWMKAIGIYLVILGHFYSVCEKFIYVFHIPLFFVISGILTKKESQVLVFWKKLWYNLIVPMLIMAVVNFVYSCIGQLSDGSFEWATFYWFVRNVLFGMVAGFDTLWFVYTLVLLKIVFQYSFSDKVFYLFSLALLAFAYFYNNSDLSTLPFFLKEPNSYVDVFTAIPFFALGIFVRDYKRMLNEWNNVLTIIASSVCGFIIVLLCWRYNGDVGLYCCNYGGNMFLFLLGGLSGTMMIFAFSKLFRQVPPFVSIISRGTIIVLGLHKLLIYLVRDYFPASYLDIFFAVMIVLLFMPVIIWTEKYFPLMAGKYRINKL